MPHGEAAASTQLLAATCAVLDKLNRGVVIIDATIDEQGNVTETRILRSIPLLDEAAVAAVRQWKFSPTLLNGVPVPIVMTVTVNFKLTP